MKLNAPKPTELVTRRTRLFNEYKELAEKAQQTHDMNDGLAAGIAWRAYVYDFLSIEAQDKLNVIKFPNRGAKV